MVLIDTTHPFNPSPCIATIGFFDGVHKGHQSLIEQVRQEAGAAGLCSAVITFDQHPRQVLHSDFIPELLNTLPEKIELLRKTGIDYCFLLKFTPQLASLTALEFMKQVVRKDCNAHTLMVGYDHRFGRNRSEGYPEYVQYGKEVGLVVKQASPLGHSRRMISSSLIRSYLAESGQVDEAARALGYFYSLSGCVVHGRAQGRELGFPTANIRVDGQKLIPADGVYAVYVRLENETERRPAVLNIGCRPTMANGNDRSIEVHLLEFSGDLYNTVLEVGFLKRIREQRKFSTLEELSLQIKKDASASFRIFSLTFSEKNNSLHR